MDRRQKKTRSAIFTAFGDLLAQKNYNKITVQEIIDTADIGRTTFYAHFETKDDLLKELCAELFDHIIQSAADSTHTHGLYSDDGAPESVFCHLLQHLQENNNSILELLSCESSELFLRYFKESLNRLLIAQVPDWAKQEGFSVMEDISEEIKGQDYISVGTLLSNGEKGLSISYISNSFTIYISFVK